MHFHMPADDALKVPFEFYVQNRWWPLKFQIQELDISDSKLFWVVYISFTFVTNIWKQIGYWFKVGIVLILQRDIF